MATREYIAVSYEGSDTIHAVRSVGAGVVCNSADRTDYNPISIEGQRGVGIVTCKRCLRAIKTSELRQGGNGSRTTSFFKHEDAEKKQRGPKQPDPIQKRTEVPPEVTEVPPVADPGPEDESTHNPWTRGQVLARLEKLMRLMEGATTDGERNAAEARIQAMLLRHKVTLAEVKSTEEVNALTSEVVVISSSPYDQKTWKFVLGHAVGFATSTQSYALGSQRILFVGREIDVAAAAVMMNSLLGQLEAAYRRDAALTKDKGMDGYAWKKQYLLEAAYMVKERANDIRSSLMKANTSASALMVMSSEIANAWLAERGTPSRHKSYDANFSGYSLDAAVLGKKAGKDATFTRGIDKAEASAHLKDGR